MFMRLIFFFISILCGGNIVTHAAGFLLEAESFKEKGGWVVDQQFMDLMGSSYLLAHGMGKPVKEAVTQVMFPGVGEYYVYVRTFNWTAPWYSGKGPGQFKVKVGGKTLSATLGCSGRQWQWELAGKVSIRNVQTSVALVDLTGFDGRCDAIYFTTDKNWQPPQGKNELDVFRRRLENVPASPQNVGNYDFVVVGGGIAGMCAAVSAARLGCKVALVNDRPVLGGNNSAEVRVHLGGYAEIGPNKGLGRMLREFGHSKGGNAKPAEFYEDDKKQHFIQSEPNVTLYANSRAFAVKKEKDRIASVTIRHIETGHETCLKAPLFADCTGDGTIGFLAGADYRMGREARSEYNESLAPDTADKLTMGASMQWYSTETKKNVDFPEFNYGITFNDETCEKVTMGEWTWETGMNYNQITDAERIRDYGLLVVYSNWSYLKNHYSGKEAYRNRQLGWLAYIAGKRESRRLLGDYILTQNDIDKNIPHEDASFTTTWSLDLHRPDPKNSKNFKGEEFKAVTNHVFIHPYAVPYRCLYSRNVDNLFMAGRDISVTHVALGTVRVMRTTGMMGEVVGMAASLCKKHQLLPRGVYQKCLPELKQLLQKGVGKEGLPNNQRFNLPNKLLDAPRAADTCYSRLENDTLVLGNQCMERKFLWNNGSLRTYSIRNKKTGWTKVVSTLKDDFSVSSNALVTNGSYWTEWCKGTSVTPACLKTIVTFTLGSLEVKRIFRIYDNCPALACDTYLKGKGNFSTGGAAENTADNKNIESTEALLTKAGGTPVLDQLSFSSPHWQVNTVEFSDVTDWNNNLVWERHSLPYRKLFYRGNLLFANSLEDNGGFFYLKEAPCSNVQLAYGKGDFMTEFGHFAVIGLGLSGKDIAPNQWTRAYSYVLGVYDGTELDGLMALRAYQKNIRLLKPGRDEMVMMNTWGDRSQDLKVNEAFCLQELDKAARLGITHFQIDDGWQSGKSPNSAVKKGSFKNIWDVPDFWKPDAQKYPHGLKPIVEKGKQLGIEIGLWFNPSTQDDFADWQKDANVLVGLYRQYGIRVFKIDGLSIPTKRAEENLRNLFDTVARETNNEVVFNLDVTAGRRGGYHMLNEYGNIFLENRYTDWGNYYPYWTLRNLWMLSKYVPAERLQVEFLNKWRNQDKYGTSRFAPSNYSFDYLFAITMAGQPLAWMEASNLPQEAYSLKSLVEQYRKVQHEWHQGTILPIGNEPSGKTWTGFQSITGDNQGFLLVYREAHEQADYSMETWLPEGREVECVPVLGNGKAFKALVGRKGTVRFTLPEKNEFVMYKYKIQ